MKQKAPELLLPVGTKEMLIAAVANGADAVYFGVPGINARGRTIDLSLKDVESMIEYARLHGVKTYLAMNILIFEQELLKLPQMLGDILALRPDAFIIQDIGLARLVKAIAPKQEIHASTQMTIASAEGANFVKSLGFSRVVLSRELSIEQIEDIANNTDLELEVFVHGALCVSYSGQCLTSENFGGRSGNRGQCAQSCRLPYKIILDGNEFDIKNTPYIFSPHDLSALPLLENIRKSVHSLKVEGRLKSPEYVAAVAKAYRHALDNKPIDKITLSALKTLFSRGLSTGWLEGIDYSRLVEGSFSNHHGEFLGKVKRVKKNSVWLIPEKLDVLPSPGDGILFEEAACGSRLCASQMEHGLLRLDFLQSFDTLCLREHMRAFKNDSPSMESDLQKLYAARDADRNVPIDISVILQEHFPIKLSLYDGTHTVTVVGDTLESAKTNRNDIKNRIENVLSSLSGTPYIKNSINIHVEGSPFFTDKILRQLRQEAVKILDEKRKHDFSEDFVISVKAGEEFLKNERHQKKSNTTELIKPELSVLIRTPEQLKALEGLPLHTIYMDFDWGVKYDDSLKKIHDLGYLAGIATLRVHKPHENNYLKAIENLCPERVLVRNLASLFVLTQTDCFKENKMELVGDYSLNIANSCSANFLLNKGLKTFHPSLDLNAAELFDLINAIDSNTVEIALHQYLPAFHAEYCVFANFGAKAKKFPECKTFCIKHKMEILDNKGKRHFLKSDAECRNTLYLGTPRSALRLLPKFIFAGVNKFRLEMLDDSPETVRRKAEIYLDALHKKISLESACKSIFAEEKYGVSEGQLFNEKHWEDRKKI